MISFDKRGGSVNLTPVWNAINSLSNNVESLSSQISNLPTDLTTFNAYLNSISSSLSDLNDTLSNYLLSSDAFDSSVLSDYAKTSDYYLNYSDLDSSQKQFAYNLINSIISNTIGTGSLDSINYAIHGDILSNEIIGFNPKFNLNGNFNDNTLSLADGLNITANIVDKNEITSSVESGLCNFDAISFSRNTLMNNVFNLNVKANYNNTYSDNVIANCNGLFFTGNSVLNQTMSFININSASSNTFKEGELDGYLWFAQSNTFSDFNVILRGKSFVSNQYTRSDQNNNITVDLNYEIVGTNTFNAKILKGYWGSISGNVFENQNMNNVFNLSCKYMLFNTFSCIGLAYMYIDEVYKNTFTRSIEKLGVYGRSFSSNMFYHSITRLDCELKYMKQNKFNYPVNVLNVNVNTFDGNTLVSGASLIKVDADIVSKNNFHNTILMNNMNGKLAQGNTFNFNHIANFNFDSYTDNSMRGGDIFNLNADLASINTFQMNNGNLNIGTLSSNTISGFGTVRATCQLNADNTFSSGVVLNLREVNDNSNLSLVNINSVYFNKWNTGLTTDSITMFDFVKTDNLFDTDSVWVGPPSTICFINGIPASKYFA